MKLKLGPIFTLNNMFGVNSHYFLCPFVSILCLCLDLMINSKGILNYLIVKRNDTLFI